MKKLYRILVVVLVLLLAVTAFVACDNNKHEHNYDQIGSDAEGHWNYCKEDNAIDEASRAAHVDADSDGKCDVCEYVVHVHNYSKTDYDEIYHWNYCPDDNAKDTSSIVAHADNDNDGKCDGCGYDMPVAEEEYIGIEEINGVPTLVVKGAIPEGVECIKLHYDADGQNYYVENSATDSVSYIFNLPFTKLPVADNTPWCWFHLYTYSVATPSDEDTFTKIDLMRKEYLDATKVYEYNKVNYYIITEESTVGMVVLQAKAVPEIDASTVKITSIEMKIVDEVPMIIVEGINESNIPDVRIHADGDKQHLYWKNTSTEAGKLHFDIKLTDLSDKINPADAQPYWYFHIYAYSSVDDADDKNVGKADLYREDFLTPGDKLEANRIVYTMKDSYNMVVIQPTVSTAPSETSKIPEGWSYIEGTGSYQLVEQRENCIFIDADAEQAGKDQYYGAFFIKDTEVSGNYYAALTFKVTECKNENRFIGLLYNYNNDENGNYVYSAIMRINGTTNASGYFKVGNEVKFKDQTAVNGESSIKNQVVTLCVAVKDGNVDVSVIINDVYYPRGTYSLAAISEGSEYNTVLTSGKIGLMVNASEVEVYDLSTGSYAEYEVLRATKAIASIPTEVQYSDKAVIEQARACYDALSDEQKALVQNYPALESAEKALSELTLFTITNVSIDQTNVFELVVEGTSDIAIPCMRLRANGNGTNWVGSDVSVADNKFELRFNLKQLRLSDTPWCDFFIDIYDVAEPAEDAEATVTPLLRDEWFEAEQSITYDYVNYKVINKDILCIQPNPFYVSVTSIELVKGDDNKPYLVVKGTARSNINCVKLQAGNIYSDYASLENGSFETRFDLSRYSTGDWMWFHVYSYESANPEDDSQKTASIDLLRGDMLPVGSTLDVGDYRYITMGQYDGDTWGMVIVKKVELPDYDIMSITVNGNNLVVSGVASADVEKRVLRLHANEGNDNVYGEFATISEDNTFELKFDLSRLTKINGWYWFHIYLYDSVDSENKSADFNLASYLYASDVLTTIGDIKLTVIKNENSWSVFTVKPVNAE